MSAVEEPIVGPPHQYEIYRLEMALEQGFCLANARDVVRLDSHLVRAAVLMAKKQKPAEWEYYALYLLGLREEEIPW